MVVSIMNISNLGWSNMWFSSFIARELREAQKAQKAQKAQEPREGHSDSEVSGILTRSGSTKCLEGGKSAKSSSSTCGDSSP